jgi:hypothetical protein
MVGRDEAFQELRRVVTEREFVSATVLEVTDGGPDGFLLRVQSGQRLHPHTLVVAANERSLALDHSIGLPLDDDDPRLWAYGLARGWQSNSTPGPCAGANGSCWPTAPSRSTQVRNPSHRADGRSTRCPWGGQPRRGSVGFDV